MILVIQNSKIFSLGYFEEELNRYRIPFYIVEGEKLREDDLNLLSTERYSGIIILDGPQSSYEEEKYPFLTLEKKIVGNFIEKGKPTIGIGLGCHIIAALLGSRVYRGYKGDEIGFFEVQITEDGAKDYVFSKYFPSITVFQYHKDTFDLPKNTIRIATSQKYLNQAFTYQNAYALQFHIELKDQTIKNLLNLEELPNDYKKHIENLKPLCNDLLWNLFVANYDR